MVEVTAASPRQGHGVQHPPPRCPRRERLGQLTPTYECWTVRRESRLPPFALTRRCERDRDARGRSEE
jgi:hypothetical protein